MLNMQKNLCYQVAAVEDFNSDILSFPMLPMTDPCLIFTGSHQHYLYGVFFHF